VPIGPTSGLNFSITGAQPASISNTHKTRTRWPFSKIFEGLFCFQGTLYFSLSVFLQLAGVFLKVSRQPATNDLTFFTLYM
jgi:hypothetical protein